jgi:hypothetical protein
LQKIANELDTLIDFLMQGNSDDINSSQFRNKELLNQFIEVEKLNFFMELVKQLGFETKNNDTNFPSMAKEDIIKQAIKAEKEIEQEKTIFHDQAYQEFKKWK